MKCMMKAIYKPTGRALEYSLLACNLFRGCPHGCVYCYAPSALRMDRHIFHGQQSARDGLLTQLEKDAAELTGTTSRVLLCFTCDPYPPPGWARDLTREALTILRRHNIPFQVLTKGGTRAVGDFDLYTANDAFATTVTYLMDDGKTLEMEPHAAIPSDRIQAIREARSHGITTWVSLEPVLDPDESLALIERTYEFVDLYKIGKLNHKNNSTDWRSFGTKAIKLCEKYKKPYYIKADLAKYLTGVDYENTDTRAIR